jgi:hypothetical protein
VVLNVKTIIKNANGLEKFTLQNITGVAKMLKLASLDKENNVVDKLEYAMEKDVELSVENVNLKDV